MRYFYLILIFSELTSPSLWGGYYVQLRVNPIAVLIGEPSLD